MTTSRLYSGAPLSLNAVIIQGISKHGRDPRLVVREDAHSGAMHLSDARAIRAAPIMNFTTYDIFRLLDELGDSENTPMANLTGTGAKMYFPAGSLDGPEFEAAGHILATILLGQCYLAKLAWTLGGNGAEAEAVIYGTSADGKVNPMLEALSPTFPDVEPTETWGLIKVTLPGSVIIPCHSLALETAHGSENNADGAFHSALPFPVRVVSAGTGPAIKISATIDTNDLGAAIPKSGAVALQFARYTVGGELSATEVRTITLNGSQIKVGPINWSSGGQANRQITVTATKVDDVLPLTMD